MYTSRAYNRKSAAGQQLQKRVENRYQEKYVEDARTPDWARGCGKCKGGLVEPVPGYNHIPAPMYAARVAQAKVGVLRFCTCDAGVGYRNFLLRKYLDIKYKRDPFPGWEEIENAASTPTVHYEGDE
jgi:hypothetical protein